MTKKKTLQTHAGVPSAAKKTHPQGKKTTAPKQTVSQTHQPYEQDPKRRIGQFSGTGEPPLMKK